MQEYDTHVLVHNKFPQLPKKHNRIFCGTFHSGNDSISPDKFLIKLKHPPSHNLLVVTLPEYKLIKYNLNNTAVILQDNLNDTGSSIYCQWYYIVLEIIESKLPKPPISKAKGETPAKICKNSFLKKRVELINMSNIFHDPTGKTRLP